MSGYAETGKLLVGLGLGLVALGGLVLVAGRFLPAAGAGPVPRLPLDVVIERPNFRFYFPLGWCLLLSALLSLAMRLWHRWRG